MLESDTEQRRRELSERYLDVRSHTEALAAPLSAEDQVVQSMPDVSPTKWHRAHTTWFFETFLLSASLSEYEPFDPAYAYLFNSYYEAVGARHPRPERGLISRPGVTEVGAYRQAVDAAMGDLLDQPGPGARPEVLDLVELGIHHEQQHQELLVMDIKHVLSCNPTHPGYAPAAPPAPGPDAPKAEWIEHPGGPVEVGHDGAGFAFDNESPRHTAQLVPHALANRLVTCGEWLEFIADDGYERPELWLSDGWATIRQHGWNAPLYWSETDGNWEVFTLGGQRPVVRAEPVSHVSYYEADAFARWAGARLATEAEWETAAAGERAADPGDEGALEPGVAKAADHQFFDTLWQWTQSAYAPYPGFRPAPGAVGEYNGKFMVNQYVLRGGCRATPRGHVRATYRNFFPASARWAFSGVRLARDL